MLKNFRNRFAFRLLSRRRYRNEENGKKVDKSEKRAEINLKRIQQRRRLLIKNATINETYDKRKKTIRGVLIERWIETVLLHSDDQTSSKPVRTPPW